MGCCYTCTAPGQLPLNPEIIKEISNTIKMPIKTVDEKKVEAPEINDNKLHKSHTKIGSVEIPPPEKNNENLIHANTLREKEKKGELNEDSGLSKNIMMNEENHSKINQNTDLGIKSNCDVNITIKGLLDPNEISDSHNKIPSPNSPISKIIVGPEIFVHLKIQNICEIYSIGQFLGKGAFGQVSLVTHKATGLIRAMKIIKKNSLINENENRFFAELVILKNLDHPNIVKLLELFQDADNYYLITEHCSGGELFDRIKKMNNFSEFYAANIMKQILSAVVYCHSQNIVHRDLKPENILFESQRADSLIKIIDFGTSRKFDPKKKMTKTLGTAYYIAPEVLNQNYSEKCDIWSCGVILYILLCGYPPFTGKTQEEIFYRVKLGKFDFKETDWVNISEDAKSLIKQMLRYDQTNRISAEEALNNKWIKRNSKNNMISNKAIQNLSYFHATNQIQAAIYTFIVSQLTPPQEKEELHKYFENLDKNGDGKLSPEELIEAYTAIYNSKEEARYLVARILKTADKNFSGKIDYTEFLVACTKRERLLAKNKVEQAFKLFDIDGNGYITKDELIQLMGETSINDEVWNEILEEFDTNKDGKISQTEFIDLLYHKYSETKD